MSWNANSGYVGYSMSIRAKNAYDDGEMPISKWTKSAILEAVKEYYGKEKADLLRKYPVKFLKSAILYNSSWHHTSAKFNKTNFYSINDYLFEDEVENVKKELEEKYSEFLEKAKEEDVKEEEKERKVIIQYALWGGSFSRPKFLGNEEEEAIIKGNYAFPVNDKKFKDDKGKKN